MIMIWWILMNILTISVIELFYYSSCIPLINLHEYSSPANNFSILMNFFFSVASIENWQKLASSDVEHAVLMENLIFGRRRLP